MKCDDDVDEVKVKIDVRSVMGGRDLEGRKGKVERCGSDSPGLVDGASTHIGVRCETRQKGVVGDGRRDPDDFVVEYIFRR